MKRTMGLCALMLVMCGSVWGDVNKHLPAYWDTPADSAAIYIRSSDASTIVDSQAGAFRTNVTNYDTVLSLSLEDSSYNVTIMIFYPGADTGAAWVWPFPSNALMDSATISRIVAGIAWGDNTITTSTTTQREIDLKLWEDVAVAEVVNVGGQNAILVDVLGWRGTQPLALSAGDAVQVDVFEVSGDEAAADSLERMLDGTGATLALSQLNVIAVDGNKSAIVATGNGTADGINASGGAGGGAGLRLSGGATSGSGILATGGSPNGSGVTIAGVGVGSGIVTTGGSTSGPGIFAIGGAPNGFGINILGDGTGHGLRVRSGDGATGNGIDAASQATNGHGMNLAGAGTGDGLNSSGGATGSGVRIAGGGTSGDAIHLSTTSGDGFDASTDVSGGVDILAPDLAGATADSLIRKDTASIEALASNLFGPVLLDSLSKQGSASSLTASKIGDTVLAKIDSAHGTGSYASSLSSGSFTAALGVVDTLGDDSLVSFVDVDFFTLAGTFMGSAKTNSDGYIALGIDSGKYLVRVPNRLDRNHLWPLHDGGFDTVHFFADGDTIPSALDVAATDSAITGFDVDPGTPASANTCVVSVYLGDVTGLTGENVFGIEVTFTLPGKHFDSCASPTTIIVNPSKANESDINGIAQVSLRYSGCVGGTAYKMTINHPDFTDKSWDITVPSQATYTITQSDLE